MRIKNGASIWVFVFVWLAITAGILYFSPFKGDVNYVIVGVVTVMMLVGNVEL